MPQYSIYVSCNQCGGEHPTGVAIHLDPGPHSKQSIRDVYHRDDLLALGNLCLESRRKLIPAFTERMNKVNTARKAFISLGWLE